jgi:hypothetical protein
LPKDLRAIDPDKDTEPDTDQAENHRQPKAQTQQRSTPRDGRGSKIWGRAVIGFHNRRPAGSLAAGCGLMVFDV